MSTDDDGLSPEDRRLVDDAVERMRAERDEARATKDVHKERATQAEARAHDAEAKRDALRDDALAAVERMRAERDALAARVVAVQRILAATYYNPAKALSDIREALR